MGGNALPRPEATHRPPPVARKEQKACTAQAFCLNLARPAGFEPTTLQPVAGPAGVLQCLTISSEGTSMATLTIRLDEKLDRELARLARRTGRTKSEVAREALRRQLTIQRFRALRREAMPYAAAAGYLTDEDVFRSVS
jgi:predicted transcriptional regulator